MHLYLLMLAYAFKGIVAQLPDLVLSPCPKTFYYEPQNEPDKWVGDITIQSPEKLIGIWLTVKLDRRAEVLGNWFGEAYSSDNIEFRISNPDYVLEAGPPVAIRFFIRYNPIDKVPRLDTIRLNGKTICSQNQKDLKTTTPKLHISKPTPTPPTTVIHNEPNKYVTTITDTVGSSSSVIKDMSFNSFDTTSKTGDRTSGSSLNTGKSDIYPPINIPVATVNPSVDKPIGNSVYIPPISISNGLSENILPNYNPSVNIPLSNTDNNFNTFSPNINNPVSPVGNDFGVNTPIVKPVDTVVIHSIDTYPPAVNKPVSNLDYHPPINNPVAVIDNNYSLINKPNIGGGTLGGSYPPIALPNFNNPDYPVDDGRTRYPVETKPVDHQNLGYNQGNVGDHSSKIVTGTDGSIFNLNDIHGVTSSSQHNDTQNDNSGSRDSDDDFFHGDFNAIKVNSAGNHVMKPLLDKQADVGCGTVALRPKAFIAFGQDTVPGQWPWHAAVYHTKGISLMYICGASLVSTTHVLIAAHCVTKPRTNLPVDPEGILVYFGKYNLRTFGPETQDRDVAQIIIHPNFNNTMFYNDIAIIKLSRPVEITDYVRPVCLWEDNINLETIINQDGTVIGWGFDENKKISEKLMQAKMPVVSTIQCIYSNREFFARFTSDSNFCAGFRNGTSVCNGDSGGSMVFPKKDSSRQNPVWQIRGIVSVGVALQTEGICDTSQYVIFTDVAKYLPWIKEVMNSN